MLLLLLFMLYASLVCSTCGRINEIVVAARFCVVVFSLSFSCLHSFCFVCHSMGFMRTSLIRRRAQNWLFQYRLYLCYTCQCLFHSRKIVNFFQPLFFVVLPFSWSTEVDILQNAWVHCKHDECLKHFFALIYFENKLKIHSPLLNYYYR